MSAAASRVQLQRGGLENSTASGGQWVAGCNSCSLPAPTFPLRLSRDEVLKRLLHPPVSYQLSGQVLIHKRNSVCVGNLLIWKDRNIPLRHVVSLDLTFLTAGP